MTSLQGGVIRTRTTTRRSRRRVLLIIIIAFVAFAVTGRGHPPFASRPTSPLPGGERTLTV